MKIELQGKGFEVSGKATKRMRVLMKICDRGGVFCADEKTGGGGGKEVVVGVGSSRARTGKKKKRTQAGQGSRERAGQNGGKKN